MSYLKRFNRKKWDWYAYLRATDRTKEKHYQEAVALSDSWITCACGQICEGLPRWGNNRPYDDKLARYGTIFAGYIQDKCWVSAKVILDSIEKRTSELLNKQ